jgi:DNA-binding HxlR family transcriptional regulator
MGEMRSEGMRHAEPGNEQRAMDADPAQGEAARQGGVRADVRGDIFSEHCPSREVLRHVTGRWGVLLLVALMGGPQRFGELRRRVGGISERMLAQTLVWLEQDGFVQRIVHPVAALHVEYRLTPLGEEVGRRAGALADWIEENMGAIQAAQRRVAGRA